MFVNYEDPVNLSHWGPVMLIRICKLTIIGSDNGLLPGWCQAIIWMNAGMLLFEPWEQNSVKSKAKICEMAQYCLGLNVSIIALYWDELKLHVMTGQ